MTTPIYHSTLGPAITQLLALRHSLGYRDKALAARLVVFDRYLAAHGQTDPWLTREVVDTWVSSDARLKPVSRARRYSAVRLLGRFLADRYPQTYIPGPTPGLASTFRPHIYTLGEIQALLQEAARLTPVGSLRPRTFVTLLGVLYCTGLRVSEALALRLADVDLADGLLIIRHGKFDKARMVPLRPDVQQVLTGYVEVRRAFGHRTDPDAPLFVNARRRPCSYSQVFGTFLHLARRTGVRGAPGQRGPRVHDLRHSFAVHQLVAWYRDGGDVQARLPLLATYMGHVCLGSTQVYLDITAELLHEAGRRFQAPPLAIALGDR